MEEKRLAATVPGVVFHFVIAIVISLITGCSHDSNPSIPNSNIMATFEIPCECGASLRVLASQAGTDRECRCGRTISIPRFSELQKTFRVRDDRHARPAGGSRLPIGSLYRITTMAASSFVLLWHQSPSALLVCLAMFLLGKVWFLLVMFREMGAPALLIFIVPFLDWMFLFVRFDVAWKPVVLQFLSVVLGLCVIAARAA
jgi:hypothetical protein